MQVHHEPTPTIAEMPPNTLMQKVLWRSVGAFLPLKGNALGEPSTRRRHLLFRRSAYGTVLLEEVNYCRPPMPINAV